MGPPATVYVALLDEGTAVWRPVVAERVGPNLFRLTGPAPDDESWEFVPGTLVRCQERVMADGSRCLVAVAAGCRLAPARPAGHTAGSLSPTEFVMITMLLVVALGDKPADAAVKELEALCGEWVVVAAERGGKPEDIGPAVLRFTDQMPKNAALRCDVLAVAVDPAATPKRLTGTVTGGEVKGDKWLAIYRLDGDKLTICFDYGGKEHPVKFQTADGDGRFVYHLERKKR